MTVKILNSYTKAFCCIAFYAALIWYDWISANAVHLSLIKLLAVATIGFAVVCSALCATVLTVAGAATYALTSDFEGSIDFFSIAVVVGPVATFFATRWLVLWVG